ncbi:50S ribosomal protein L19e [Sulfolobus sp. S-194]|uniref:50S ribosomal protein L19e n=1 Tax=Sulfolobus sp. S-194 TaxID=2512240 RepID=UPI001437222F|nr:50S ribosomal protein L19e [Sulfolobus sp. S-194]QIW23274.1 50S ribosomal protein L19e [Sulfolobus sp. S-194]
MPEFALQRRLAAELTNVGENNVKFNTNYLDDIASAITRGEIRKLIKEGKIIVEKKKGISSGRLKEKKEKRRKRGEKRKSGSRKGPAGARRGKKEQWVLKIRKIRTYLKWLRDNDIIDKKTYRLAYRKAKGNSFRNLSDVKNYLKQLGVKVE